jgi:hypothetical protein
MVYLQLQEPTMFDEIKAATAKVQALLDDKELWLEMEALSMELHDQLDDMNDAFRNLEGEFRKCKVRPGWVPVGEGEALLWNGQILQYENQKGVWVLLGLNKELRIKALSFVTALCEELSRERLIPNLDGRTTD